MAFSVTYFKRLVQGTPDGLSSRLSVVPSGSGDPSAPLPPARPTRHGLAIAYTLAVALDGLLRNRTRSFLAMLGIIIGVASVITMMGLGEGSRIQMEEQIRRLGTNMITVRAGQARSGAVKLGAESSQRLTLEDAAAIVKGCPDILRISPRKFGSGQVKYEDRNTRTRVMGLTRDFFAFRKYPTDRGRLFNGVEEKTAARVCVIGPSLAQTLFGNRDPLGKLIRVRGQPFTVLGILGPRGGGDDDWDERVWMPISTYMQRLVQVRYVDWIETEAVSESRMDQASAQIEEVLRKRHHLRPEDRNDFEIRSQLDTLEVANQTSGAITALLAGIAGISLLVGGIGIMNIMLVSVTERTREIGIRRAVGARRIDILCQFLIESLVLCGAGALFGLLGGFLGCWIGQTQAGWPIAITPFAPTAASACSIAIGVVFGIYPAYRASRLSVLEALRFNR